MEANHPEQSGAAVLALEVDAQGNLLAGLYRGGIYRIAQPITSVETANDLPRSFQLFQNFPNPFNPITTIHFDLPEMSTVTLSIYNVLGQQVAKLVDGEMEAGFHRIEWRGTDQAGVSLASGVYMYRIDATANNSGKNFNEVRKMLLLR